MATTETEQANVFVMPEELQVDEDSLTDGYGRFTLQPLERGFGTTVGNALRRTLLSSLPGSAIESVRLQGVQHEFTTVPGMVEDVPEFVLNIKEVRLVYYPGEEEEGKTISVQKEGAGELTAADLDVEGSIEIINKDHVIAHLDDDAKLDFEFTVGRGRGFVLAEDVRTDDTPVGTIPVDAIYSPIRKVNFEVSDARVGQRTDYDRLDLEVWTDGSTVPAEALAQAARLLRSHFSFFLGEGEVEEDVPGQAPPEPKQLSVLDLDIEKLELSMRSLNCLRAAGITKVEELVGKSETDMLKYRNFGRKSLIELTEKLEALGLRFGMNEEEIAEVRASGLAPPEDIIEEEEE